MKNVLKQLTIILISIILGVTLTTIYFTYNNNNNKNCGITQRQTGRQIETNNTQETQEEKTIGIVENEHFIKLDDGTGYYSETSLNFKVGTKITETQLNQLESQE